MILEACVAMSDLYRVDRRGVERMNKTMTTQDFQTTLLIDATPDRVFDAITDVRGWWSEEIEGRTDALGAVFEFRFQDLHRSTHEITELVRGKRVAWRTVDARINFVKDKTEWNGTNVVFDIEKRGEQTALTFTHQGLVPAIECYSECSGAWGFHLGSLRDLIVTGKGEPNRAGES